MSCQLSTHRLSSKKKWLWTPEAQWAFQQLQQVVTKIKTIELTEPLEIFCSTDASKQGLDTVLYQENKGEQQVVSYASAKLHLVEQHCHSNKLESLTIVWGIKNYRPYVQD